jgi:hypothetical protein
MCVMCVCVYVVYIYGYLSMCLPVSLRAKPFPCDAVTFCFFLPANRARYVSGLDPLRVFIFPEGLARFATHKYSFKKSSAADRFMHLTNYRCGPDAAHKEHVCATMRGKGVIMASAGVHVLACACLMQSRNGLAISPALKHQQKEHRVCGGGRGRE